MPNKHCWIRESNWSFWFCTFCGIVRRVDGKNLKCSGKGKVIFK